MSTSPFIHEKKLTKLPLCLWLLAGVLMLLFLGGPDVSRTQEARVLETAREMLGRGWYGWIVPHLNGQIRLEKPPMAYWLAAASFKNFHVGPAAGRLPFALIGWLSIGLVYRIGARLFDRKAGVLGAAALLGSFLFFRNMRLAETDGPSACFAAAGVWWMWRGLVMPSQESSVRCCSGAMYFNLSACAIAIASMFKQEGLYPLLFLVAWVIIERRWLDGWRWIKSGAPLTLIVLASPWWFVTIKLLGYATFKKELHDVATGRDHFGWPWIYIPWLLRDVAPWIGLAALALVAAVRKWKVDAHIRFLLIWAGVIFVMLCCVGNKQEHYLLPLMFPVMVLVGWLLRQAMKGELAAGEFAWFRLLLLITLLAGPVAAGALFFLTRHTRGEIAFPDVVVALLLVFFSLWGLAAYVRRPAAAALLLCFASALVMPYALGKWAPSLVPYTHVRLAQNLEKKFGTSPICFYGKEESVPLAFALQRVVPQYASVEQLSESLRHRPHLLVLIKKNSVAVPAFLEEVFHDKLDDQEIHGYVKREAETTNPAFPATRPSGRLR